MLVCNCCYEPIVLLEPFASISIASICVSDDTPVKFTGPHRQPVISSRVLEDAGMQWKLNYWNKPDGQDFAPYEIYDLTVDMNRSLEPWERDLEARAKEHLIAFLRADPVKGCLEEEGRLLARQSAVLIRYFRSIFISPGEERMTQMLNVTCLMEFRIGARPASIDWEGMDELISQFNKKIAERAVLESGGVPLSDMVEPSARDLRLKLFSSLALAIADLKQALGVLRAVTYITSEPVKIETMHFDQYLEATEELYFRVGEATCLYLVLCDVVLPKLLEAGFTDARCIEWRNEYFSGTPLPPGVHEVGVDG